MGGGGGGGGGGGDPRLPLTAAGQTGCQSCHFLPKRAPGSPVTGRARLSSSLSGLWAGDSYKTPNTPKQDTQPKGAAAMSFLIGSGRAICWGLPRGATLAGIGRFAGGPPGARPRDRTGARGWPRSAARTAIDFRAHCSTPAKDTGAERCFPGSAVHHRATIAAARPRPAGGHRPGETQAAPAQRDASAICRAWPCRRHDRLCTRCGCRLRGALCSGGRGDYPRAAAPPVGKGVLVGAAVWGLWPATTALVLAAGEPCSAPPASDLCNWGLGRVLATVLSLRADLARTGHARTCCVAGPDFPHPRPGGPSRLMVGGGSNQMGGQLGDWFPAQFSIFWCSDRNFRRGWRLRRSRTSPQRLPPHPHGCEAKRWDAVLRKSTLEMRKECRAGAD